MHKIYNIFEYWSLINAQYDIFASKNRLCSTQKNITNRAAESNWEVWFVLQCKMWVGYWVGGGSLSAAECIIMGRCLFLYANVIATTELLKRWQLVVDSWQESVFKYSTDRQITKLQLELPKNKNRKLKNHINKRGQVWCAILLALVPRLKVRTTCL